MTELRYSETVTQIVQHDKNSNLISIGWYILKAKPRT